MRFMFYGSLRKGFGADATFGLENSGKFIGQERVPGKLYAVSWFPGAVLGEDKEETILCDVYETDNEAVLTRLDQYEGFNPERQSESLFVRRTVDSNYGPCFIYEYNQNVQGSAYVEGGDWGSFRRNSKN